MSTIPDAIRIEDEVWQEAFATRVSAPKRGSDEVVRPERIIPAERRRANAPQPPPTAPPARPRTVAAASAPARRTVVIKGRGAERHLPWPGEGPRQRPPRALHERAGFRPDRLAMWAVFLGLLLVLVAVISSHG